MIRRLTTILAALLVLSLPAFGSDVKKGDCGADGRVKRQKGCASGPVGHDYSADATAEGCWLMFSNGVVGGAEADNCISSSVDNATYSGDDFNLASTTPDGTPAAQDAVEFDGTADFFTIAHDTKWESDEMTIMCWGRNDGTGTFQAMDKAVATAWGMRTRNTVSMRATVDGAAEDSAGDTYTANTWFSMGMRYSGGGAQADATEDAVEIFIDGIKVCSGACNTDDGIVGNDKAVTIGQQVAGAADWVGDLMECVYRSDAISDQQFVEILLCGYDGLADGEARDSTYGAANAHCSDLPAGSCC